MTAPMNSPAGPEFAPSVSANQVTGRPGTTPESFGEEVHRRRSAAGVSQQQLADLAGVSRGTIKNIEGGTDSTTVRIADAVRAGLDRAESPPAHEAALSELREQLDAERAAHQRTLALLRAIRALLDSHGGLQ